MRGNYTKSLFPLYKQSNSPSKIMGRNAIYRNGFTILNIIFLVQIRYELRVLSMPPSLSIKAASLDSKVQWNDESKSSL